MNLAKYKELEDLKVKRGQLASRLDDTYTAVRKSAMDDARKNFTDFFSNQGFKVVAAPIRESVSQTVSATYNTLVFTFEILDATPKHSKILLHLGAKSKGSTYLFSIGINNPREKHGPSSWSLPNDEDKRLLKEIEMTEQEIVRYQEAIDGLSDSQVVFSFVQEKGADNKVKPSALNGKEAGSFIELLQTFFPS